jgi:transcription elongation factor Elf1
MGMFDSIIFDCPKCGKQIEAQSKGGVCLLECYGLYDVPVGVASDANKDAPFICEHCGSSWQFDTNNYVVQNGLVNLRLIKA